MENINLSNIEYTLCNPFYLSLIIYIILLSLILYSFDQSDNVTINNHIKFFLYSYLFLVLFNIYINDFTYRKIKQEYRLGPNNEIVNDIMK